MEILKFKDGDIFTWDKYSEKAWKVNHRKDKDSSSLSYSLFGLIGEIGELIEASSGLDVDDIRKEIGDVLWYCNSLCVLCGISMDDSVVFKNSEVRDSIKHLTVFMEVASFSEKLKKKIFHKNLPIHELSFELSLLLRTSVIPFIYDISKELGSSLEQDAILNIEKLYKRYSNGEYTEEKFDKRVDVDVSE